MPFLTTNIKKVRGLSGSDPARYENLENSGPFFAIGGQAMFGSGSPGSPGTLGGFDGGCTGGDETTGMPSGGDGTAPSTSMSHAQLNNCSPPSDLPAANPGDPSRPDCPECPKNVSGPNSNSKGGN